MEKFLTWRIVLRQPPRQAGLFLPGGLIALAAPLRHAGLPDEVGLLLPNRDGLRLLIEALGADPGAAEGKAVGLFLADPFLHVKTLAAQLAEMGVVWVVNFPSVEQQDREFSQQLADVGLDSGLELARLAGFRDAGFGLLAAVADADAAAEAVALDPAALLMLPRVGDFAAGFPSFRQRGAAAAEAARAAHAVGWSGAVLGLGKAEEAEHQSLWPDALDGLAIRDFAG
ncbi:MAG: hypothetical protein WDZ84_03160 [Rhodovibrionaceae bacterium]